MQPFDQSLNDAILSIAACLFPEGFDVSDNAPETYQKLKAHLDAGKRMVVYGGGCEDTIYADPRVNHAFRAWHDWCHWRGGYNFSVDGEIAVCSMQCRQLVELYGANEQTRLWTDILRAEIVGQRLYYHRYKRFIEDQRGFIAAYLKDPEGTLLWSLW